MRLMLRLAMVACVWSVAGGARDARAQSAAIAAPLRLDAIHMVSTSTGWATSGQMLWRTTDGGSIWTDVMPHLGSGPAELATSFLSGGEAFIAVSLTGDERRALLSIYHTTDGGLYWRDFPLHLPAQGGIMGGQRLDFADRRHGWLLENLGVGAGQNPYVLLRTTDGAAHWTVVARSDTLHGPSSGLPGCDCTDAITFRNASTGFATGTFFAFPFPIWLYVTHDAGYSWSRHTVPLARGYVAPEAGPPAFFGTGGVLPTWLAGPKGKLGFEVFTTPNGGASWKATTAIQVTAGNPLAESFSDLRHGWVGDGKRLFRTTDSGHTWRILRPRIPAIAGQFRGSAGTAPGATLDFIDAKTGFALTQTVGGASLPLMLRSTDGGQTWRVVNTLSASRPLH